MRRRLRGHPALGNVVRAKRAIMWLCNIFCKRKRAATPHGPDALMVVGVSVSTLFVIKTALPWISLPASAAEDYRDTAASRADGGRYVPSSKALPIQADTSAISVSKSQATSKTGGTHASPNNEVTLPATITQRDDTRETNSIPDPRRAGDGLRQRTGSFASTHSAQNETAEFPSPLSVPQRDNASALSRSTGPRKECRSVVCGASSLGRYLAELPENWSGASSDTATLSASGSQNVPSEQKAREKLDERAETPEAEIFEGRSRFEALNSYATSLTDKFAEKIASLAAQVDLLRMDVVRARDEVQRLNDVFDARTEETIRKIEERSTNFGADLSRLEKQLEWQLNPDTGIVSKRIGELRHELLKLRTRARDMFEKEATVYVQQVESCSSRLDSLTEIYFDLKTRTDLEVNEIESCMVAARRRLEETMQEQLNILTETERKAAARASQRFRSFLRNLRLEGNVLHSVVQNIQRRLLESQATFGDSGESSARGAAYIDMSGLFADSKVEKVCVVVTQLVKGLLAGNEVVPIFIHSVGEKRTHRRPTIPGGSTDSAARPTKGHAAEFSLFNRRFALGSAPVNEGSQMHNGPKHSGASKKQTESREAVEMVLPNAEILEKVAALWLRERREYGLSYDHYAVIRIEGYLMEYFSVPFLEYNPYSYATEDQFITVNAEQFATSLKSSIEEKLSSLEANLQKQTYLLIAYVGEVAADKDVVRPRPSLLQTKSRVNLARQLTQSVKPRSPSMYFIFQYFQQMLLFTDKAEQVYSEGAKRRHALQGLLAGDDVRVLVLTDDCKHGADDCNMWGTVIARTRSNDPFFGSAFAVLRLTLKQLAPDFLVFPSDYILAVALDQLVWEVTGASRPPGPLSLLRISPRAALKHSTASIDSGTEENLKRSSPWPGHTSGVLITTDGKAGRGWSTATLTASLSVLVQRRKRGRGTPAHTLGLMMNDAISDEVVTLKILKDSSEHAVRVSLGDTIEEVAKHTLSVTLRVMRGKLDYLGRGYTLYVCVNLV